MAHRIPKNAAGQRVPSVTTICKMMGGSIEGLLHWAHKLGLEGKPLREESRKAMDVGTVAHELIAAAIAGQESPPISRDLDDAQVACVMRCMAAWDRWREQNRLEIVASEMTLVSEKYQYGGTLDLAAVYGKRSILDIKTGNGVYQEALLQIRAYGHLWEENKGEEIDEYHVIRLGKEDGSFHHHVWNAESLVPAWEAFKLCIPLHGLAAQVKKLAA